MTKRTSDFARIFLVVFVLVAFNETNSVADDPSPGKQVSATAKFSLADGDAKTEVEVRHWIFLPADYGKKESGSPLLLFLHGAGERGNNLPIVKKHGPPKNRRLENRLSVLDGLSSMRFWQTLESKRNDWVYRLPGGKLQDR